MWYRIYGYPPVEGVLVQGDETCPRTRWWNHLYLLLWGWKTVAVFEVSEEDARLGYRVGYEPLEGAAMFQTKTSYARRFRMRIGREACKFFAFRDNGEVSLTLVIETDIWDAAYHDAPLY
ncbi:MAG: hypothetical protein RL141_555 [Candidatus Parcubacteria bacterium]